MGNSINNRIDEIVKKARRRHVLQRLLAFLCTTTILVTSFGLRLPADTLERAPLCGLAEHIHDAETCFDEAGELVCGLAEHAHTDACYPTPPDESDIAPESTLEPPVEEAETFELGDDAEAEVFEAESTVELSEVYEMEYVAEMTVELSEIEALEVENTPEPTAEPEAEEVEEAEGEDVLAAPLEAEMGVMLAEAEARVVEVELSGIEAPYSLLNLLAMADAAPVGEDEIEPPVSEIEALPDLSGWTLSYDENLLDIKFTGWDYTIEPLCSFDTATLTVEADTVCILNLNHYTMPLKFPARQFEAWVDGLRVSVAADEGAFPEGTTMEVVPVYDETTLDGIAEMVETEGVAVRKVHAVDITFRDANGQPVEPLIPISVQMSADELKRSQAPVVVHLDDAGYTELIEPTIEAEAVVTFDAAAFSVYALVVTERYISADGSAWNIVVTYGADADIPDGATLDVRELADAEYQDCLKQAAGALNGRTIAAARFFDIGILSNGQRIQPAAPVEVSVSMAREDGTARAVHFGDEIEVIRDVRRDGDAVVFDAQGFSVYGILYTVDFEAEGYAFALQGGGTIRLSELLERLNIEANLIGSNVEFTDDSLLALTPCRDDADVVTDWALTSLKPFLTAETLTLTLADGRVIEISVTDAVSPIHIINPAITLSLVDGAVLEGTDWVYHAQNPDREHAFSFQIDYSFSTDTVEKRQWEPGQIEIHIPLSVLRNRSNALSDTFLMSLPQAGSAGLTEENEFVYSVVGDELVISNRVAVRPTQVGFIQFSYLTAEQSFAYGDYQSDNEHPSDPIQATLVIKPQEGESFTVEGSSQTGEYRLTTDEIQVHIDTTAELTATNKRAPTKYTQWQAGWGTEPAKPDAGEYVYLLWSIESNIRATQPFNFDLTDAVQAITEDIDHYEVVGFRPHGQSQFTMGSTFTQVQNLTPPSGEMIRTDHVLTRHSISGLPQNWDEYIVKNTATATVTPADGHDAPTTKSDDETFADQRIRYGGRPGNINAGKTGLTTSYQLSELIEKGTPVTDLRYDVFVEGYTWYYTYQGVNGETAGRDADYSDTNYQYYGQRPVTFTIQENNQRNELAPDPTAERHNLRVWYKQPGGDEYAYSDWLKPGDYQIDQIEYSYVFRGAEYDSEQKNFIPTDILTAAQLAQKNIVLVFTLEKDGEPLDGEIRYSLSTGEYTPDGAAASCFSSASTAGTLVFAENAHITGYTLSNTNALYYTLLRTRPSFSLLPNAGDSVLNGVLAALGEKPTMNLWNTAILKVTQDDDLKNYYTRQHFDTVLGDFKESRITKGWIARRNDPVRRMYTITWNVGMEETYTIDDETSYVRQDGGRFYDLLPLGTEYVPGSLEVYADGVPLAEGEYFTNLETNYGYEGRDLLSVGIIAPANRKYTFSYDTQITWNTILERRQGGTSLTLHNAVAYVKNVKGDPETIAGYDGNLLPNRVPDEDAMLTAKLQEDGILDSVDPLDRYAYALMTTYDCEVTAVVSGTLGLNKLVRGANPAGKFEKTDFTYTNDEYAYRLSFGPYAGTQAKDLILFDFLENWEGDGASSLWHGAFKSIEMKIVEDRGVDAKLYVSTLDRATLKAIAANAANFASATGNLEDIRYNGQPVWGHITKPDDGAGEPPNFTAIAIDLRKKQDGTDFVLDGGETISVTLHMTAPDRVVNYTLNAPAYNDVYLQQAIKNRGDLEYQPTDVVYQGHTEINYRVAGDLWLLKVDRTDNTKTVGGTTFRLSGTSAYGTPVDLTGTTSEEGWLSFQHLEMTPQDGYYELREVASSPDYLLDNTVFHVQVDNQGKAGIVNDSLPSYVVPVYIDVSGEPRVVQSTGEGVVKGWRIGNEPRMHGDLVFAKRGTIDRKNISVPLAGATFRLTPVEGGTHYHNTDVHEATSDAEGNVVFPNIEWGEYTLEEIAAPQGYLLLKEVFHVTCDGTNGVVISIASDVENSRFFEEKAKDSATVSDMDKEYTITNEAIHELKLYKVDAESGEKLAGAAFALTGTSESGASVNLTAQSLADGTVTFAPLEPGTYYLQETHAPDNHVKDAAIYTVTVKPDGGIGIAWGTDVARNYVEENNARLFIVAENAIEGNARHAPSEIYYDGFGKRFNFPNARERTGTITIQKEWVDWDGSSALPVPVVEVRTTVDRAQQTPAFIDPNKWRSQVRERFRYSGSSYCTKFLRYDSANFTGGQTPQNNVDGWILVSSTEKSGYNGKFFVKQIGKTLYWWADTEEIFIMQRVPSAENEAGWDLFRGTYIEEADLSAFTLSRETTSLWKAFAYCPNLTRVVLPKFEAGCQVTDMAEMFLDDKKLSEVRFPEINTAYVKSMSKMFYNCYMLERLVGFEQFDTQRCSNMEQMFAFCGNGTPNGISELDLSSFTIISNASCYEMFWGMTYLRTIYVSEGWVNANIRVESRNGQGNRMFIHCPALVGEAGTKNLNNSHMLAKYAIIDGGSGHEGLLTYRARATAPPSSEVSQHTIETNAPVEASTVVYTTNSVKGNDPDQWVVGDNGVWTYEMPVYAEADAEGNLPEYTITEKQTIGGVSYLLPWVPLNNALTLAYQNPAAANTVRIRNEKSTPSGGDPATGTLIIQKQVKDPDGDPPANWSFDFNIWLDQSTIPTSRTVTSAQPIAIINDVPIGTAWSISEIPTSAYIGTVIPVSGTISDAQPTVLIEAVNTVKPSSLKVKLTVNEQPGVTPDPDAEFEFEITLTDEHGNPVTGVFGGPQGALEFDEHGKTYVTLKDGDERQIDKLPDGTQYTITEITKDFGNIYDPDPDGSTTVSDDIEAGDADEVPFVIIKKADEPRGGFTLQKAPGGNAEDVFRFRIEFTGLKAGKTYTYQYGPAGALKTATFTANANGRCTIEGCELKFAEKAVFAGLAEDVTFTVTELANDYVASYVIDDSPAAHRANTAVKTALATDARTIHPNAPDATITFTNAEPTFPVRIGKQNPREEYLPGAGLTLSALDIEESELVDVGGMQLQRDTLAGTPAFYRLLSTGADAAAIDLKAGSYLIEETTVPVGYKKAPDMRVDVSRDGTVTVWSVERVEGDAYRELPGTRMSGPNKLIEIDMVDEPYVVETFQKRWTDAIGANVAPWPENQTIQVTLSAGAPDAQDVDEVVTLEITPSANGEFTVTQKRGGVAIIDPEIKVTHAVTENVYAFTLAGLPVLAEGLVYRFTEAPVEGYQTPVYMDENLIENRLATMDFSFNKLWKDTSFDDAPWPTGKTIAANMYRKVGDGEGSLFGSVELRADGGTMETYSWNATLNAVYTDAVTFSVDGLPAVDEQGRLYTYYVTEAADDEYYPTYRYQSETTLLPAADGVAYDGYYIRNVPVGHYELPSTGGVGLWPFHLTGALLTLLAGALLWRRRREWE